MDDDGARCAMRDAIRTRYAPAARRRKEEEAERAARYKNRDLRGKRETRGTIAYPNTRISLFRYFAVSLFAVSLFRSFAVSLAFFVSRDARSIIVAIAQQQQLLSLGLVQYT